MIDDKRHVPVLDAFISWAARLLNANETMIREMVHERAGWFVRFAGLDEKIADKILEGLTKLFDEMETDPAPPVRLKAGSEEGRVEKECVGTCRTGGSP